MRYFLLSLFLCLGISFQILSQTELNNEEISPIVFIYDASGSMLGQIQGRTKMEIAREVLKSSISDLSQQQEIGLVAYGHRQKGDCRDVEFMVDIDNSSKTKIADALTNIKPLGKTPLAHSASLVIDRLRNTEQKATIILLTDGIESCDGNVCSVVASAKAEGIDFKLHIIGFGLKSVETEQLVCAARAGDGQYFNAADTAGLTEVMNIAIAEPVNKPKGNVSVFAIKNGKPIDAIVMAYDQSAKRQPISVRTYKDTAYVYLPPSSYNLEVRPLEGSDVDMVKVGGILSFEDKMVHETISFDGGKVKISTTNNGEGWDCIVKLKDASGKVVASVRTYGDHKEIEVNPGEYSASIEAIKIKGLDTKVEIEQITISSGETSPIKHDFKSGLFKIESWAEGNSIDSTVTIADLDTGRNITAGRTYGREKSFTLGTGAYTIKVMPLGNYKDREAQVFNLEIKQEETVSKKLTF